MPDELTVTPTRSREELIRDQGWAQERVARDLKWRRTGFPEEQVERYAVAFMVSLYGCFFGEGPPWYIFEPGELAIATTLTEVERLKACARAIEVVINEGAQRGTFSREDVIWAKPVVRNVRAQAVMYERRARLALPSREPLREQRSRGGRPRRRRRTSRSRARAPASSASRESEPPLAAQTRAT